MLPIAYGLNRILFQLEPVDIENEELVQKLRVWIERYPIALGKYDASEHYIAGEYYSISHQFRFPLCRAILEKKYGLIPFFIELRETYFNDGLRGGLLLPVNHDNDPFENNGAVYLDFFVPWQFNYIHHLDALVHLSHDDVDESEPIRVLRTLKSKNIFHERDVQEYNLLTKACILGGLEAQRRFHFLVALNPDPLFEFVSDGDLKVLDAARQFGK